MRAIHPVPTCLLVAACAAAPADRVATPRPLPEVLRDQADFLDDLQRRTFDYFWETAEPGTGLAPDRWPSRPFASIAAVGFALTAYPIGVERDGIEREEARDRTLETLRFFWNAPQGAGRPPSPATAVSPTTS